MSDRRYGTPQVPKSVDISRLVEQYPSLKQYEGQPITWTLSAIHSNNGTVGAYLDDIRKGSTTGNVEYHQQLIGEALQKLPNDSALKPFKEEQTAIHQQHEREAKEVIGSKIRGGDGIYRGPAEAVKSIKGRTP